MKKVVLALGDHSVESLIQEKAITVNIVGITSNRGGIIKQLETFEPDILLLRDNLPGTENILEILFNVRREYPSLEIIVLASGRHPGDPVLASLVNYGIFNILYGEEVNIFKAIELFEKPMSRQDVQHLQTLAVLDEDMNKTTIQAPPEVIYKDRLVSPGVIAVGSIARGIGCTYTALSVASFLYSVGHKVALIEAGESNDLLVLAGFLQAKPNGIEGGYRLEQFDVYPKELGATVNIENILRQDYNYFIFDLGVIKKPVPDEGFVNTEAYRELNRANIPVLVGSSAPWRWRDYASVLKDNNFNHWNLVISGGDPKYNSNFQDSLPSNKTYFTPLNMSPFDYDKTRDDIFKQLLEPVLPAESVEKKKRKFLIFDVFKG